MTRKEETKDSPSMGDMKITFWQNVKPILKERFHVKFINKLEAEIKKITEIIEDKDYNAALRRLTEVYEKTEKALGATHRATIDVLSKFGLIYRLTNRHSAAISTYRKIYFQRIASIGPRHPDTLESVRTIADLLKVQGRYDLVCKIYDELDDGDSLQLKLAEALQEEEKYEDALEIFRRLYAKRFDSLGAEHSDTQSIINYIAKVLIFQKKFEDAFDIYENLSDEADKYNNWSILIRDIPKSSHEEILKLYAKLYAKSLEIYGPNFTETLCDNYFYVELLEISNDVKKAPETNYTEEIFNVTTYFKYLSFALIRMILDKVKTRQTMDADKGIEYFRLFLKQVEDYLGPDDKHTLCALCFLGSDLEVHGRYKEALEVYKKIINTRWKYLHKFSDSDLKVVECFTMLLPQVTKEEEILFICKFFAAMQSTLGLKHDYTLSVQFFIGHAYHRLNQYDKALIFYSDLFVKQTNSDSNHLKTLQTLIHVSHAWACLRHFDVCNRIFNEALDICRKFQVNEDDVGLSKLRVFIEKQKNSEDSGEMKPNSDVSNIDKIVKIMNFTVNKSTGIHLQNEDSKHGKDIKTIAGVKIVPDTIETLYKIILEEYNIGAKTDKISLLIENKKNVMKKRTRIKRIKPTYISLSEYLSYNLSDSNTIVKTVQEQENTKYKTAFCECDQREKKILEFLSSRTKTELLEILINFNNGNTPLHFAARKGSLEIVDLLLRYGAIPTANEYGYTPLHYAAYYGNIEIAEELLMHVKYTDESKFLDFINYKSIFEDQTALHIANHKSYLDVEQLLLNYGADNRSKT